MSHGDVKEGNEKDKGPDEAPLHGAQLLGQLAVGIGKGGGFVFLGERGPIARLLDSVDNVLGAEGVGVVVHRHGVGHQADLGLGDGLQLVDCLFHMGGASRAGHAGYVECLLHFMYLLFILAQAMWFGRDVKQAEQVMPGIGKACFKEFPRFLMNNTPLGWGVS